MSIGIAGEIVQRIAEVPSLNRLYLALLSLNCRLLAKLISRLDELPPRDSHPSFEQLVIQMVNKSPSYGIEAVRYHMLRSESSFKQRLSDAPEVIQHFEDLYWLFSCNQTNAGIISMALDEAAYLYRVAHSLKSATCLEIGRFKGGSTFLLAVALDSSSILVSVDNHTKMTSVFDAEEMDAQLLDALSRYGLENKTKLVIADSTSLPVEDHTYDLVFFDGDHSYEGVCRDWLYFRRAIKLGGHAIFHDAGATRRFAVPHEGVQRLVQEIEAQDSRYFVKQGEWGTIVDFRRTNVPLAR